jgi:hypothetical protein
LILSSSSSNPTNPSFFGTSDAKGALNDRLAQTLLYSSLEFHENQYWIDLPLLLRYNFKLDKYKKWKRHRPYIYAGGAANFLLSAQLTGIQRKTQQELTGGGLTNGNTEEKIVVTKNNNGNGYDIPSLRRTINTSLIVGAGIKFSVGTNFIFVDARYNRFFLNMTNIKNRYENTELLYKYNHIDDDIQIDNVSINVGFMKSFYKPRKKRKYNARVLDRKFDKWLEKERVNMKRETDEDIKRELNASIKEMEKQKPSLIEDVERGRVSSKILKEKKAELNKIKK